MEEMVEGQDGGHKLNPFDGRVSQVALGRALRPATKRAIKQYLAFSEVAARARENLADVYAEAKHEYYTEKQSVSVGRATTEAAVSQPDESVTVVSKGVAAGAMRQSRKGARLALALLSRAGQRLTQS